jgi:hypothetical protein
MPVSVPKCHSLRTLHPTDNSITSLTALRTPSPLIGHYPCLNYKGVISNLLLICPLLSCLIKVLQLWGSWFVRTTWWAIDSVHYSDVGRDKAQSQPHPSCFRNRAKAHLRSLELWQVCALVWWMTPNFSSCSCYYGFHNTAILDGLRCCFLSNAHVNDGTAH